MVHITMIAITAENENVYYIIRNFSVIRLIGVCDRYLFHDTHYNNYMNRVYYMIRNFSVIRLIGVCDRYLFHDTHYNNYMNRADVECTNVGTRGRQ